MKKVLRVVLCLSCAVAAGLGQDGAAVVRKDTLSVHTVERGSMPIFRPAKGTLVSVRPARAVLKFSGGDGNCQPGRSARLLTGASPRPLAGKVVSRTDTGECEVEFGDRFSESVSVGQPVEALIVSEEMKDVVFLGRPAVSQPNSTTTIFVLEDDSNARRVRVRYGVISGPLIQVLDGLVPGDKVIVTDMSRWAGAERVRLE